MLAGSLPLTWCVDYSMHRDYDVKIAARDYESAVPVGGAQIAVSYHYDSYGWFLFMNTPDPSEAVTDQNGEAVLRIADYRYGIRMRIADMPLRLNKKMARKRGDFDVPAREPVYKVELSPICRK